MRENSERSECDSTFDERDDVAGRGGIAAGDENPISGTHHLRLGRLQMQVHDFVFRPNRHLLVFLVAFTVGFLMALLRRFLVIITIEGTSMSPTLEPGDRIVAIRWGHPSLLRKGSIVLVSPISSGSSEIDLFGDEPPFIKRIVAVSGDVVISSLDEIDESNRLNVEAQYDAEGERMWFVPAGHVFFRGDAPTGGFDSLTWGPLPTQRVLATMIGQLPSKANSAPSVTKKPRMVSIALVPGMRVPAFAAETINGQVITSENFTGKPVILIFASLRCAASRRMLADFALVSSLARKNGVCFSLVIFSEKNEIHPLISNDLTCMNVILASVKYNSMRNDFKVYATPSFCRFDINGVITHAGYPSVGDKSWVNILDEWKS